MVRSHLCPPLIFNAMRLVVNPETTIIRESPSGKAPDFGSGISEVRIFPPEFYLDVVQFGSMPVLGTGGRGFKSLHLDHNGK